jgi:hypothetical protein
MGTMTAPTMARSPFLAVTWTCSVALPQEVTRIPTRARNRVVFMRAACVSAPRGNLGAFLAAG